MFHLDIDILISQTMVREWRLCQMWHRTNLAGSVDAPSGHGKLCLLAQPKLVSLDTHYTPHSSFCMLYMLGVLHHTAFSYYDKSNSPIRLVAS